MNKISMKEAIATGAWFECHAKYDREKELHYRLRVVAFNRTSVEEIDRSRANEVCVEGVLWLLSVEIVNLCKTPVVAYRVRDSIKLIDEDGFEFEPFRSRLDDNENAGLYRFSCQLVHPPLAPKVKAIGDIAFDLPDDETNYYLSIKDGNVREA